MVTPTLVLSAPERKIVVNSIIWVLGCPFEAMFPPLLGDTERADLERLLHHLEPRHHTGGPITISIGGRFSLAPDRLRVPYRVPRLMSKAVASFYGEKLHSAWEYKVLTCQPLETAEPLMKKLKTACRTVFDVAPYRSIFGPERKYRNTSLDHGVSTGRDGQAPAVPPTAGPTSN